jgi:subtilisin family serine protease
MLRLHTLGRRGRSTAVFFLASTLTLGLIAATTGSARAAAGLDASRFTATPLQPAEVIHGLKSRTARIAESDAGLLRRNDARLVNVVVKLDYDSVAAYRGGIPGLRATSPAKTGKDLDENARAVRAYTRHVVAYERGMRRAIEAAVPSARIHAAFRTVYGGLAIRLPANQARKLLQVRGVAAVQHDALRQLQTDATPQFVGATQVWPSLGGRHRAGEGVIVGVLDSGIWPNHPSFADPGISHPGGSYACEFGDGTNPELGAPFACNDKLIGAHALVDTYMTFIGAAVGEFCDNDTGECSARDADGHGTHTASTAAGSPTDASIFGINRGSISGMAPGAHVIAYRVCLDLGCFETDSMAAVEQAIEDGVDVVNFSIGGGASPYSDPVELGFLDAYDAGILVNASAGNSGPGASTADHAGGWVNTVGASTSNRHFLTTVQLGSSGGASANVVGASVTTGIASATPVIRATDIVGYTDEGCLQPFPAGAAAGKVVVCKGSFSRNLRSYNVFQAGGAGMLLHGITRDLFTDNFWVPTVMLSPAQGDVLQDFLNDNTAETARWSTGTATAVRSDVMTNFSSRGPVGDWIKPDVTAPGMEILAGTTPDPHDEAVFSGPPGEHFQAISGTSMSSPHAAGVSALVKDAHPDWTPGQIKSALMTSSVQDVLKEDGVTSTDAFDRGAGSIRANRAVNPTVTFDVTTAQYVAAAANPLGRIHVNLPSVSAPTMPGIVTTTRRMKNVSGRSQELDVETEAPEDARIIVRPREVAVRAGGTAEIRITIDGSDLDEGQYFGEITLDPERRGATDVVIPVAFYKQQGAVTLTNTCDPTSIPRGTSTDCRVMAENFAPVAAEVDLEVEAKSARNGRVVRNAIRNVSAPGVVGPNGLTWSGTLSPALAPAVTGITEVDPPFFGYIPLALFGVAPIDGMGDEDIANLGVSEFEFGTETYDTVGMVTNGYAVVGGGDSEDIDFVPQTFPDPAAPNNVLAPFWSDLNLSAGGEMRAAELTDGTTNWIVLEWTQAPVFSNTSQRQTFQIWIETAATGESVTFTYGPVTTSVADPANTGAENRDGSSGVNLGRLPETGEEFSITTAPPQAGGNVTIDYEFFGANPGLFDLVASLTSNVTPGVTVAQERVTVTGGGGGDDDED